MSKFQEQQSEMIEKKTIVRESEKTSRETLGKYYYDLSKLAFATSVLNGSGLIFTEEITVDRIASVTFGILLTIIFAMLGYRTIKIKQI